MMRPLQLAAIRAFRISRRAQRMMRAAHFTARWRGFLFWNGHDRLIEGCTECSGYLAKFPRPRQQRWNAGRPPRRNSAAAYRGRSPTSRDSAAASGPASSVGAAVATRLFRHVLLNEQGDSVQHSLVGRPSFQSASIARSAHPSLYTIRTSEKPSRKSSINSPR